jgi:hypothetical protein
MTNTCGSHFAMGLASLLLMGIAACSSAPRHTETDVGTSLDSRIGWLHKACFAVKNDSLQPNVALVIVKMDEPQSTIHATVLARTMSDKVCPALLPDRKATNTARGLSFYEVSFPDKQSVELGIGIIGLATNGARGIDVNGDGKVDRFTQCATSEGISFGAWSGTPYEGKPLWSGYYYLGYDAQANCPGGAVPR